jgi:hypothetical protein
MKRSYILLSAVLFSFLVLAVLYIVGCGTNPLGGGSPIPATTYNGTQSPGDAWTWIIGNDTFLCTNEALGYTLAGDIEVLNSGFRKATITYSSTIEIPGDGSAHAYFLEVPNTALIAKPTGESENVIYCAASAATFNPSINQTFNFVSIPNPGFSTFESGAYGFAKVTDNISPFEFTTTAYNITGGASAPFAVGGFEFADGILTNTDPLISGEFYITPSGVFAGDNGKGEGGVAGFQAPLTEVSTFDFTSYEYLGLTFNYNTGSRVGQTLAVGARPHDSIDGGMYSFLLESIESGTPDPSAGVTIEFTGQPSPGILEGLYQLPGEEKKRIVMIVRKISNKYLAVGITVGDSPTDLTNFLVIQK